MGGQTLNAIATTTGSLAEIRKSDLLEGDCLIVTTMNSTYQIRVLGGELFAVSGGWFEKKGIPRVVTRITGCTWGGTAVKTDIVAATGLCLEFGNRLTTSNIMRIVYFRCACVN